MAEQKDKLDWWGKPDHLNNETKEAKKSTPKSTPKSSRNKKTPKLPLSKRALTLRIVKHCAIIMTLVVLGAVSSHFILTAVTRHDVRCTVPQLEMLTMEEAQALVAQDELMLIINDSLYAPQHRRGAILDQLPKAGMVVKPGRAIYLTVNATQRKMVDVPYVAQRSLRQAKNMLETEGLTIEELVYEDDLAKNYILAQYVDGKEIAQNSALRAPVGTAVTLHVGRGDDPSTLMPLILGMTLHEAQSALWSAGLNVGDLEYDQDDSEESTLSQPRIFSQSVRAEEGKIFGDRISMKLSRSQIRVDSMKMNYFKMLEQEREAELAEQALRDSLEMVNRELMLNDVEIDGEQEIEQDDEEQYEL